jgi:Spy/CpxP family protein refolding chaperone
MKKVLVIGMVLALAILALGIAGLAYAQSENPPYPGYGQGMMGGRGGHGGMMGGSWSGEYGPMHTYMTGAFAEALGLTSEEFQTRRNDGETFWEIAESLGFNQEEIAQLWAEARTEAVNKSVEAGLITPEQAEWMLEHMAARQGAGYGQGAGGCMGGGLGTGYQGGGRGRMGGGRWTTP